MMKKLTLFLFVVNAILFMGCEDKPKKDTLNSNVKAVEETTAKAPIVLTEETSENTTEETTLNNKEKGKALYASCQSCHGADGNTMAMGRSAKIAGQDIDSLVTSLKEYKAGTKDVNGMGMVMKGQVAGLSEEEIELVSEYISEL
jgi:cytochrome c